MRRCCALAGQLAVLAVSVGMVACAASPGRDIRGSSPHVAQSRAASPAVWGAERGLELVSWIVADPTPPRQGDGGKGRAGQDRADGDEAADESKAEGEGERGPAYTIVDGRLSIERILAPYADRPLSVSDEVRFRWHASGLRIVAVPVADLPQIQKSLRLVGPTQRQWLGEAPQWTDLVRGPAFSRSRRIATDTGTMQIEPGRLRLLVRAWIAPEPGGHSTGGFPPAALRLEMVPQHEPQLSEPHRLLTGANNTAAEAQGRLFQRLALGLYMQADEALIIVPDSPESDWSTKLVPRADGEAEQAAKRRDLDDAPPPSLGEAMLAAPMGRSGGRTRGVIVLIAHIPQRFELR